MSKNYVYIFTRQDMSFEQQAVQTAHVTFKLGHELGKVSDKETMPDPMDVHIPTSIVDPQETYFTLVGVRNLEALEAVWTILDRFDFAYEVFIEPDMNDEPTAIAVYPLPEEKKGPLLAFNLLRMK